MGSEVSEQQMVAAVKEWALANYENGADVIVEAFTDEEIAEEIVEDATTVEAAVASAAAFCGLRAEQASNCGEAC